MQLLLYLGELLHIVAVVLQSQLGCLKVEPDAEVPSTCSDELEWLSCKSLFAQRLVPPVSYPVLPSAFAIDLNENEILVFSFSALEDFDVGVGSFAGFEAEVRLQPFRFLFKRFVFTVRHLGLIIA